ncbi:rhodanese-like domain-containing protein [Croceivirga thetidis]|uniref:Rhodanese-like domain-containing protein n=1 Tax=Croceivirga thetidis TaxID=2721623 RepID=A0ABX1GMP6_9FLAO|nr:rhodanese-like domain-containing protein [Croceivirga thetidis]NKI30899.1 rhodanese-like domain-containing protein [Croceivirga thetidis]
MKSKYHLLTFLLSLSLFFGCQSQQEAKITKIDKTYLKENVIGKQVQLVDVRTAEEYEVGRIGDAVNFNVVQGDEFLEQIKTLDKSKPVYLYCKAGGRSNRAAELLKAEGFTQIFDYSGGYNDWVQE